MDYLGAAVLAVPMWSDNTSHKPVLFSVIFFLTLALNAVTTCYLSLVVRAAAVQQKFHSLDLSPLHAGFKGIL